MKDVPKLTDGEYCPRCECDGCRARRYVQWHVDDAQAELPDVAPAGAA